MSDRPERGNKAAAIRGDIQAGATGDKRPGFDPAAAPLETDGEAGGNPMTERETRLAREGRSSPEAETRPLGYGDAMRPTDAARPGAGGRGLPWFVLPGVAVLAVAALLLWLMG